MIGLQYKQYFLSKITVYSYLNNLKDYKYAYLDDFQGLVEEMSTRAKKSDR